MIESSITRDRIVFRPVDEAIAAHVSVALSVPLSLGRILAARGLTTFDECKRFFRVTAQAMHDPFLFTGMEDACVRIWKAIDSLEPVTIYGDYDADGVTATALLFRGLKALGANVSFYLPNRLIDGYGLNSTGIHNVAQTGCTLIVTVDCGITAAAEVELARTLGIDVIVTDHHEPQGDIPKAIAVLDHKLPTCNYPEQVLAGVGVALKLVQGLVRMRSKNDTIWESLLDLASIGTAADIVPLTGENRAIACLGFARLRESSHVGIRALITEKKLDGKPLSTSQVVFQLAPCMNAVGRLGDPTIGVALLITDDQAQASAYAAELVAANFQRRIIDAQVQKEAFAWIETNVNLQTQCAIVAGDEKWHPGVIGIVASKIIERHYRPTILFAHGADGKAKGSGRSIGAVHLLEALSECEEYLLGFGGHAAAAGMTIEIDKIPLFREAFIAAVQRRVTHDDLIPQTVVDTAVSLPEIDAKYYRIIDQMGPFGPKNRRPVFVSYNCSFKNDARIVGENHLKCNISSNGRSFDAIGFGLGGHLSDILKNKMFTVAFTLEENEWNGQTKLQLQIKGIYP